MNGFRSFLLVYCVLESRSWTKTQFQIFHHQLLIYTLFYSLRWPLSSFDGSHFGLVHLLTFLIHNVNFIFSVQRRHRPNLEFVRISSNSQKQTAQQFQSSNFVSKNIGSYIRRIHGGMIRIPVYVELVNLLVDVLLTKKKFCEVSRRNSYPLTLFQIL